MKMDLINIREFPLWVKAALLILILGLGVLTWWLASPLFLPGDTSNEDFSEDDANIEILSSGEFVEFDNSHYGRGTVQVVRDEEDEIELRFVEVEIANGPQLVVYLSNKESFSGTTDTPGTYKNLGELPAQNGNFSMMVPNSVDLDNVNSVMIWCDPFDIVFTYASLSSSGS